MRIIPFLTAMLVMAVLYLLIFERDAVLAFAQSGTEVVAEEAGTDAELEALKVAVVVQQSEASMIDSAVILRGRTEAARQVEVRAETSGLVVSEPIRRGAEVAAGDILCELDPGTRLASLSEAQGRLEEARARLPEAEARIPEAMARIPEAQARMAEAVARVAEAEANLSGANARLEEAQINLTAAERLSEDGFASETRVANAEAAFEGALASVSSAEAAVESARAGVIGAEAGIVSAEAGVEGAKAVVESARAGIQAAEAAVAAADKEIERLTVRAPFGGQLETDTAELGSLLQPGALCATIIQLDPIKLVGFVPETEVNRVNVGALAGARLASGQEIGGRVTFLSRSADETTRTFRVEIEVANADLAIRDGQTAEMLIASDGFLAHLMPQSALTLDDDGTLGVRTVTADSRALFVPVTVLRDTIDGVWLGGLPEQADVIVMGQEYVIDGVPVDVTYREEMNQ